MDLFCSFLHNMTLIVSVMFVAIKIKKAILAYMKRFDYIIPVMYGITSWAVMLQSIKIDGMPFDLRCVPVFFVSYRYGWKAGAVALLFPAAYRLYLGGSTAWQGILFGLVLYWFVASICNTAKKERFPYHNISMGHILSVMIVSVTLNALLDGLFTPLATEEFLLIELYRLIFFILAVVAMTLIVNDDNRTYVQAQDLLHLSTHDSLTRLPNYRSFKDNAKQILETNPAAYVAMLDLDNFKLYNDTYGHQAGDNLLRSISHIFKSRITEQGFIARYGGEEFVAIFSTGDLSVVQTILDDIRIAIESSAFHEGQTQSLSKVTISIGVSLPGSGASELKELISQADRALYRSKRTGKNRCTFFREEHE